MLLRPANTSAVVRLRLKQSAKRNNILNLIKLIDISKIESKGISTVLEVSRFFCSRIQFLRYAVTPESV